MKVQKLSWKHSCRKIRMLRQKFLTPMCYALNVDCDLTILNGSSQRSNTLYTYVVYTYSNTIGWNCFWSGIGLWNTSMNIYFNSSVISLKYFSNFSTSAIRIRVLQADENLCTHLGMLHQIFITPLYILATAAVGRSDRRSHLSKRLVQTYLMWCTCSIFL